MCCEPRNHHSLDTLELWAISAEQKSNMCADALVLRVIIVIKIQPLGAFEKLTFLLHCFMAQHYYSFLIIQDMQRGLLAGTTQTKAASVRIQLWYMGLALYQVGYLVIFTF